jgi:3-deoxy-manno-octulosonate cytidylyltransferase (CMP-KDO synthetase)
MRHNAAIVRQEGDPVTVPLPSFRPIILIPGRLAARRLPRKPLADIAGAPMIVHVLRRAEAAAIGPVVVACADAEIKEAVERAGGRAVLTRPDHPAGSDRIAEALAAIDPTRRHDVVVNLQGDFPMVEPGVIRAVLWPLADPAVDIGTIVCPIRNAEELANPNVVKAAMGLAPGQRIARALYFSRLPVPYGEGDHYHHIGVYAYRRAALERFVALPPAPVERREGLEQLRALQAGMRIDAALVDSVVFGVDTPAELARARELFASSGSEEPRP